MKCGYCSNTEMLDTCAGCSKTFCGGHLSGCSACGNEFCGDCFFKEPCSICEQRYCYSDIHNCFGCDKMCCKLCVGGMCKCESVGLCRTCMDGAGTCAKCR